MGKTVIYICFAVFIPQSISYVIIYGFIWKPKHCVTTLLRKNVLSLILNNRLTNEFLKHNPLVFLLWLLSIMVVYEIEFITADPWTTQDRTVRVRLHTDFFSINTSIQSTVHIPRFCILRFNQLWTKNSILDLQLGICKCWGRTICILLCHFI